MRSKSFVILSLLAGSIFFTLPGTASASAPAAPQADFLPAEVAGPVPAAIVAALGKSARPTKDGGFNVTVGNGRRLHTHGPDPVRGNRDRKWLAAPGDQRPPVCATDGKLQQVLYGRVNGAANNFSASVSDIRAIMNITNNLLNEAALDASGGTNTADYRVLCGSSVPEIDVQSFTSPTDDFDDIVNAAVNAGYTNPDRDYTIFFDAPATNACGVGSFYEDETPDVGNANNNPSGFVGCCTGYAVTYGGPNGGADDCWFSTTPMHEISHNQGAVQNGAPHSSQAGHCSQRHDVMCYDDDGDPNTFPLTDDCAELAPGFEQYDCGYDDYFNPTPPGGTYLHSNWNLGSPLNGFLESCPLVRLSRASAIIGENIGHLPLTVSRCGDVSGTLTFDLTYNDDTALAPGDYTPVLEGQLEFAAGQSEIDLSIPIINDSLSEGPETFKVAISNPSGGVPLGGTSETEVTIRASDQKPDNWIKLASDAAASYRGKNVYAASILSSQTRGTPSVRRGRSFEFHVIVENDGHTLNTFKVLGKRSSTQFDVIYRLDGVDRTSTIGAGTGRSISLHPGHRATIRVIVKPRSNATLNAVRSFTLLSTWTGDSVQKDIVKGQFKVVR